jgi:hypothetical protein
LTDVGLPGMNGRQIAEIARQHRPDLPGIRQAPRPKRYLSVEFQAPGMEMISPSRWTRWPHGSEHPAANQPARRQDTVADKHTNRIQTTTSRT